MFAERLSTVPSSGGMEKCRYRLRPCALQGFIAGHPTRRRVGARPRPGFAGSRRHIGLYSYRVSALRRMSMLQPGQLEQIERLEQLRALENGLEVRVADAIAYPGPSVDSQEDLARVAVLMNRAEAQPS